MKYTFIKETLIEHPTVKVYCIMFYLVMAEGILTYRQVMAAYLLTFKCLKERLVNKCIVWYIHL